MDTTKFKSNSVITAAIKGRVIELNVKDVGTLTFDTEKASGECNAHATMHGWMQRIRDKAAIGRDPTTAKSASPLDKFNGMKELIEHYETGTTDWETKRAASGLDSGLLFQAVMRAYPAKGAERVREWMKGLDNHAKAQLMAVSPVKEHVEAIRKEAGKEIDAEALLGTL